MTSQPEHPDTDTRELRDQLEHAATALIAVGGLVDEWRGINVHAAASRLRTLLATPTGHPAFEHVAMLREDLQHVVNLLAGAGDPR